MQRGRTLGKHRGSNTESGGKFGHQYRRYHFSRADRPARIGHRMGQKNRRADLQLHYLAGQTHRQLLQKNFRQPLELIEAAFEDRASNHVIFPCRKGHVDARPCSRSARKGRKRRIVLRNGGYLAHLQHDGEKENCRRAKRSFQDTAIQHQYASMGRRHAQALQYSKGNAGGGGLAQRLPVRSYDRRSGPGDTDCGRTGRPAERRLRPALLRGGRRKDIPRHRRADERQRRQKQQKLL